MRKYLLGLIMLIAIAGKSQSDDGVKALFIYQFTKMINWPSETKTGMFRIGVLGSFDAYKELSEVTMGRNVGNQNIEVMNIYSIDQIPIAAFHILLVGKDYCSSEKLEAINDQLKSKSTLIITNKEDYTNELACIGFQGEGKSFTYNYSEHCINGRGLISSKEFKSLGISK